MPLLMLAIILTIQFALVYLGNQAVSAAAREAARTARTTGDPAAGQARGYDYAKDLGGGLLRGVKVDVGLVNGGQDVRAEVSADGEQLLPFIARPRLNEAVQGPVEQFREDQ
jgi:hypothetical protein